MIDPVLMFHPNTPTNTVYMEREAYRGTWYDLGWRSNDDPTFTGGPGSGIDVRQFITWPIGGGLRQWQKARFEASTRIVRIAWLGASTGVGEKASVFDTKGFRGLVDARLRGLLGDGGSGFMGPGNETTGTPGSGPVTVTGSWTNVDNEGGITKRNWKPTTPGAGATITIPGVRGRFIDVFFKSNTGWGSWGWTINGVSQTALNFNQAAAIRQVTVDMGSSASRTVIITNTSGDGRWYGVRGRNNTGYIGENLCISGQKISEMTTATTLLDNTDVNENSVIGRTLEAIGPIDVAIIFLMANEAIASDAASEEAIWSAFEMMAHNLVTGGPTQSQPPDKIVINEHFGASDTIPGFSFYNRDAVMLSSFNRDFADAVSGVLVDVWAAYRQSWQVAQDSSFFADPGESIHLGDAGHAKVADAILRALLVS